CCARASCWGSVAAWACAAWGPPGAAVSRAPPAGFAPVGFAPVGFAPVGFAPVGFAPVGFAPVGFAPVGFAPVRSGPRLEAFAGSKLSAFRSWDAPWRALAPLVGFAASTPSLFAALNESAFRLLVNSGEGAAAAAAPSFPLEPEA